MNVKNLNWKWTIRNRVQLMLGMSLAGILIIIGFTFYFLHAQNRLNHEMSQLEKTSTQTRALQKQMLHAQAGEKAFLNNPSQAAANQVKTTVTGIEQSSKKWKKDAANQKIADQYGEIYKSAKAYGDAFNQVVVMQSSIGYSANDGLRKLLSDHFTAFKKMADDGEHPDLKQKLLSLRLDQLQYMLNHNKQSFKQFQQTADDIQSWLINSDMPSKNRQDFLTGLLQYTNSFQTIQGNVETTQETEASFKKTASNVEDSVASIVQQLNAQKQTLAAEQAHLKNLLTTLLIIVSVIVIGLLALFGFWLLRSISRSIASLKNGAAIIGEGNLAYRVKLDTEDEMGDLARTFNGMAEKMQRAMKKVLSAADRLSSSSQNLAAVSEETTAQANEVNEAILQVSAGAQNQAEHLEESTELIGSVTTAVSKTADYGDQIAGASVNAEKEGKNGLETVHRLDETSEQFIGLTSRLIDEVQKTSEQSKEINSIVQTIKEIAGNTDLLALNAAIESARAGEAGKGFAVVAAEVRKLAERSKTEAQHIQKLVNTISQQMARLSEDADQLNEYRENQGTSVKQTKSAFEAIVENVSAITRQMTGAQTAIGQVEHSNQNLSAKLEEVSAISEESAASAQQVSAASDHQKEAIEQVNQAAFDLQNIALDLQQEVSLFQLHEGEIDQPAGEIELQSGHETEASDRHEENPSEEVFQAEKETAGTQEEELPAYETDNQTNDEVK
ncbi:MAG TPA: methyl-accepting chemotaxis protein [Bacillales bacterium]|nr:methyl-accepting chemotaxis protein [Bacillales bacterium]